MNKQDYLRLAIEWQKVARRWADVARSALKPTLVFEGHRFPPLPANPERFKVARNEALSARDNAAHYMKIARHAAVIILMVGLFAGCAATARIATGEPELVGYQYALFVEDGGKTERLTSWSFDRSFAANSYRLMADGSRHYYIDIRPVYSTD